MVVKAENPLSALWLGRKTRENAVSENSIFWVGCFFFFFFFCSASDFSLAHSLLFSPFSLSLLSLFLSFPFPFSSFHLLLLFLCVLFIVRDTPPPRSGWSVETQTVSSIQSLRDRLLYRGPWDYPASDFGLFSYSYSITFSFFSVHHGSAALSAAAAGCPEP